MESGINIANFKKYRQDCWCTYCMGKSSRKYVQTYSSKQLRQETKRLLSQA